MCSSDEHLAVHHDVVLVALEQGSCLDGVVQERDERSVRRLVQVVDAEIVFDLLDARLEHTDGALLLVDFIVFALNQSFGDVGKLTEPAVGLTRRRTGDDQRRARLVDKNRVDLIDDGKVVSALNAIGRLPRHVVAQVVEAKLVVRAVGNVGHVLLTTLLGSLTSKNHTGSHTQSAVNAAHQFTLIAREIVIHRDNVHATTRDGVEVGGERRHERLSFTGLHFSDVAEVKSGSTHQLHVEVTQTDGASSCLAHGGECFGEHVFECLALGESLAELGSFATKFFVGQVREALFECVDCSGVAFQLAERATLTNAEDFVENVGHVPDLLKGIVTGLNEPDGRLALIARTALHATRFGAAET